jgi:hypothetical protein
VPQPMAELRGQSRPLHRQLHRAEHCRHSRDERRLHFLSRRLSDPAPPGDKFDLAGHSGSKTRYVGGRPGDRSYLQYCMCTRKVKTDRRANWTSQTAQIRPSNSVLDYDSNKVTRSSRMDWLCSACVSAAGRDPTHKPAQVAHSACLFALMAGSRSSPIGTPPSDDSKRRFKQID